MAALVIVLMVPVIVGMLMTVHPRLVAVLMSVMGVGTPLMAVLVLMLVFIMAAHLRITSFSYSIDLITISC